LADIFTAKKRSEIMSHIRSTGTKPEEKLFRLLSEIFGKRRRIERNVQRLPGQPDILVPSLRLAIFVDGCFYHSCPKHGHNPKSNLRYWIPKLSRNLARDRKNRRALRKKGFAVWRFWEHSLSGLHLHRAQETLIKRLEQRAAKRPLAGKPAQFREKASRRKC
jgi:DNA mismatch endonuclease, patch repair protein